MHHSAATPNLEFIMTKSTLTITKPSRRGVAFEGEERFETAVLLASTSPLGITAMGAFPLSLIALGQIRRRHFDDTLTLRPMKAMNATEKLESRRRSVDGRFRPFVAGSFYRKNALGRAGTGEKKIA